MNPTLAIAIAGEEEVLSIPMQMNGKKLSLIANQADAQAVSLYFHIPFCTKKCAYCHFFVLPDRETDKQKLLEAFEWEWDLLKDRLQGKKIATIYFGGGTPSLFEPHAIEHILQFISKEASFCSENPEITLEANPENITLEKLCGYREAGVNRISMGVQTLDDHLLSYLGREHSAQKALNAIQLISKSGIHNLSVDLMYDLPHQTLAIWSETLKRICQEPITHLSLYNLTIEPHTVFFKNKALVERFLPDEEMSLQMYTMAIDTFKTHGLIQYEISAFARDDLYSRHNTGYWIGRDFLGLGPSAFSYWQGKRYRNVAHLNKYCQALKEGKLPIDFEEQLEEGASRQELLAIQIRLCEGIHLPTFQQAWGQLDQDVQDIIEKLISEGFLTKTADTILLTHKGILFYDNVAMELIL